MWLVLYNSAHSIKGGPSTENNYIHAHHMDCLLGKGQANQTIHTQPPFSSPHIIVISLFSM